MKIGEPKKMARAFSGLNIFESDIVNRFSMRIGMVDIPQHLLATWPNIQFMGLAAYGQPSERWHFQRVLLVPKAGMV